MTVEFEAIQWEDGEVDQNRAKVVRVSWIEKTEIQGKITKTRKFICINDTVYFTKDVVRDEINLKVGDKVRAVVIASDQEIDDENRELPNQPLFRKRAIEVTPLKVERPEVNVNA